MMVSSLSMIKIGFASSDLNVWYDSEGKLWVENSFYKIDLSTFTHVIVKTGTEPREWTIYNVGLAIYVGVGPGTGPGGYPYYAFRSWKTNWNDQRVIEETSDHVRIYLQGNLRITNTLGMSDSKEIDLYLTFYAGSGLIKIENIIKNNEVWIGSTSESWDASTGEQLFIYMRPGGDEANDYYFYSGANQESVYPEHGGFTKILKSEDLSPFLDNYVYATVYDKNYRQGFAVISEKETLTDYITDINYGVAEISYSIYHPGSYLTFSQNAKLASRTLYFYFYETQTEKPYQPVEDIIRSIRYQQYEVWAVSDTEPSYPVVIYSSRKVLFGAPIFENLEHYYNVLEPNETRIQSLELFLLDIIHAISEVEKPSIAIFEPDMLDNYDEWLNASNDWTFLVYQLWTARIAISNWQENGYISHGELINNLNKLFDSQGRRVYDVLVIDQCMQADTPVFTDEMIQLISDFHEAGGAIIISGTVFVDWASLVRLWRGEPDLPYWYQGPINDKLLSTLFPGLSLDRTDVIVQENEVEVHYLAENSPSAIPTDKAPTTVEKVDTLGVDVPYPYQSHGFMKIIMLSAKIMSYSISKGEFKAGDSVAAQVTFRNTGQEAWTFYVGFSVQDPNGKWWDAPYETVTLNPDEEETVTLYWTVPSEAPAGSYSARVAVWGGKEDDKLMNLLDYRDELNVFQVVKPDFTIRVAPIFQRINQGETAKFIVTVEPRGGFSSGVELSCDAPIYITQSADVHFEPSSIQPCEQATLIVRTRVGKTELGLFKIDIIAKGGGIEHSATAWLQVGYAIQISVSYFSIKRDFDPLDSQYANIYFLFNVEGVNDDFFPNQDVIVDELDEWYRAPMAGHELCIANDLDYPGPCYIPPNLVSLPFSMVLHVRDSDIVFDDIVGRFKFTVDTVPFSTVFETDNIRIGINITELPMLPLHISSFPLSDTEISKQWYWFDIGMDKLYAKYGSASFRPVVVAVIDPEGADYRHPEFVGKIWHNINECVDGIDNDNNGYVDDIVGWDFADNDNEPLPISGAHGTMVAGVIASGWNNAHIAGIAPNSRIMPLRAVDVAQVAKAVRYAADNGANVIVMSFGTAYDKELEEAINYAYKKGAILVAASGNYRSWGPEYPAAFRQVIPVYGTTRYVTWFVPRLNSTVYPLTKPPDLNNQTLRNILNFSYVGPWREFYTTYSSGGSNYGYYYLGWPLSAPCDAIYTTSLNGGYCYGSGTSLAAPIVGGVASLIIGYALSKYPYLRGSLGPNEVRGILCWSATSMQPQLKYNFNYYGYGIVNACKALEYVDKIFGSKRIRIVLDPDLTVDLDLHIYDSLGRHTGLNYETGEIEQNVPGTIHTGDELGYETVLIENLMDVDIQIVPKMSNGTRKYSLVIWIMDEKQNILYQYKFENEISNETQWYTIKAEDMIKPIAISWEYMFKDDFGRGSELWVSLDDGYFRFYSPELAVGPSRANSTSQLRKIILLNYENLELRLRAVIITDIDFCFAIIVDKVDKKIAILIDKPDVNLKN